VPELPEVEVLRRSLVPHLEGDRFVRVVVRDTSLREPVDLSSLEAHVVGRRVAGIRRRAKYLLIDLEGGYTLVVHLGMSGRLLLTPRAVAPAPHEHVAFDLASGNCLRFRDPRKFGLVVVLPTAEIDSDHHFRHLGLEPLGQEFSGRLLRRLARGRRAPVKSFLMDGRLVVGVGNIYATEALFDAGIHPRRSVARIGGERWERLGASVRSVLESAIDQGGTTLNDFRDGTGSEGYFQVSLAAYGREGHACGRCGASIRRIVQSGRSTFYCPGCQR
jgi:formamidopyrimidine-DNA glycosylase